MSPESDPRIVAVVERLRHLARRIEDGEAVSGIRGEIHNVCIAIANRDGDLFLYADDHTLSDLGRDILAGSTRSNP